MTIELAPLDLSANFAAGRRCEAALDGGATVLHCDVMDGHFRAEYPMDRWSWHR